MTTKSILFMFHCSQDTGYAIKTLEDAFNRAAIESGYHPSKILFSYPSISISRQNTFKIDCKDRSYKGKLSSIVKEYSVKSIFAFDLRFPSWVCSTARDSGATNVYSYWGASMSSINSGLKLLLKRLEFVLNRRHAADIYIFESRAMQKTATDGRGIPASRTLVVHTGVDTELFKPEDKKTFYCHNSFGIPSKRKIIFYSGHMEERKGVMVLIECAIEMFKRGREDFHFVICGNKPGEEQAFINKLKEKQGASEHVTFGGYRSDIAKLLRSSDIGAIASTGWDSFPMSGIETLSSGIPLVASNLQGIAEIPIDGETGYLFSPGDFVQLADKFCYLLDNEPHRLEQGRNARQRALENFSKEIQLENLSKIISQN